ncbi:CPBP family intramembrane metalloprotease [Nocardia terpenica]|nr:CPBP family intramembrane metalloprotease [Nocardia terpenica]MBF6105417.1 CPBP family intramembrane metalloprotease [Nocardia terpenica]MBF6113113.1 CPBP family intramembrane metalloprotease [Nocardia terpenica]MBF6119243.1 CPBP family intramembrane metalloprotease [Nocardia terpenica]MBF6152891.1 CPBP family intramembrane metalloprotease [Nocardia terpenica]
MMTTMPDAMPRYSARPGMFLLLVAALSVPFYLLGALAPGVRAGDVAVPASATMFVVPALAALALTVRRRGATRALLGPHRHRPPGLRRWYALALLTTPAVTVAGVAIACAAGLATPALPTSPAAAPALVVVTVIAAACEELGWTGYATDPLRRRHGTLAAALILGTVWAAWHLPALIQAGHPPAWLAGWCVGTLAARLLLVTLHTTTGGLTAPTLAHAQLNLCVAYTPGYDHPALPWICGLLTTAAALTAHLAATRATGTRTGATGAQ